MCKISAHFPEIVSLSVIFIMSVLRPRSNSRPDYNSLADINVQSHSKENSSDSPRLSVLEEDKANDLVRYTGYSSDCDKNIVRLNEDEHKSSSDESDAIFLLERCLLCNLLLLSLFSPS